jgi:hypothetical protein
MKYWLFFVAIMLAMTRAQVIDDNTVGILSYVDINFTASSECVAADFAECLPHVEIIDMSQFRYCQENEDIGDCTQTYAYRVPYITTTQSEAIEDELKQHWRWYYREVISVYNKHIWEFPFCVNLLAICPDPGIDWTCLTKRLDQALEEVLTETQPEYWKRVYETVAKHEPFALWYQTPYPPLPNGGAIVSPVSSFEPNIDQVYDLVQRGRDEADRARRSAYYFQDSTPGAGVDLPIPYTPDEIDALSGGIQTYEIDKAALETVTLLEQQQFGFGNFFTLWDEITTVTHFALLRGPYAPGWCTSVLPPFTGPTLTPLPAVVYPTNEARVEYSSAPEGYGLTRVRADPLLNPLQ